MVMGPWKMTPRDKYETIKFGNLMDDRVKQENDS